VDSDWSYSAIVRIGSPGSADDDAVSAVFRHACLRRGKMLDYVAFYGSKGTIHIDGSYGQGAVHICRDGEEAFRTLPPDDLSAFGMLGPAPAHWAPNWIPIQRSWNALAMDFAADIRGTPHAPYFTLRDGWRHQELIDAIRAAAGRASLPPACQSADAAKE
jgi:predicted dehydrogenase